MAAAGEEQIAEPEIVPPQVLEFGDTRPCYMKLMEPSLDGQQVGDLEVVAVATIGPDGKVVNVEVPALATLKIRSWAKSRIQRWATCIVKSMRFVPGTQNGTPVETSVGIPLKSWNEIGPDLLGQRESVQAELRSAPQEYATAYRVCVAGAVTAEHRVLYQFSINEDGRANGTRALDSSTDRDINRMGHCIIEKLRFEPQMRNGKYARLPVHWGVIITPQPGD